MPAPVTALAASCTSCGGLVPLRLLEPRGACPYCDSAEPLPESLAQRVDALRQELLDRSAREQQLIGGQTRLSPSLPLIPLVLVWGLVCGLYMLILNEGVEGFPGVAFFLHDAPTAKDELTASARGVWWLGWLGVSGVCASALLSVWSGFRAARVAIRALDPLPPLSDGQPLRCRTCGADLPREGRVRRCDYCGSDHLVSGEAYRARAATLEASLSHLEEQLQVPLEARQEAIENAALLPVALPIPLVFVGWATVWLPPAPATIWALPLVVLAAAGVVWVRTLLLPRVAYRAGAYRPRAGDVVLVERSRLRAWAELEVPDGRGSLRLLLVGAADPQLETAGPALQFGLLLDWVPGRPARAARYRITKGLAGDAPAQPASLHQAPTAKGKRKQPLAATVRRDDAGGVSFPREDVAAREIPGALAVSVPEAAQPLWTRFTLAEPTPLPHGAVALAEARRPARD